MYLDGGGWALQERYGIVMVTCAVICRRGIIYNRYGSARGDGAESSNGRRLTRI
jgi:hypothetical protein